MRSSPGGPSARETASPGATSPAAVPPAPVRPEPGPDELVEPHEVAGPELDPTTVRQRWAWRQRMRERPHTRLTLRVVVGILGGLLILAGAITGPLPGPGGIPLVLAGLAVWSSEFHWAHRLMQRFKQLVRRVGGWSRRRKVLAVLAVVVVGWTAAYTSLWFNGIPGWVPDGLFDLLDHVPGLTREGRRG